MGLLRALLAAGHRVVVVAPDIRPDDVDVNTNTGTGTVTVAPLRHLRRRGLNPLRDLWLLRELATIYRRECVDVALHFTIKPVIYGSLAARLAGVRNVSTLTGLGFTFLSGGLVNRLARGLYRYALATADRVLFHNPDDLSLFVDQGLVDGARAAVVPGSGLDPAAFPYTDYSEATPGSFLFAGRLLTDKGVREYVAAARALRARRPELTFHVVGGPDPGNPASVSATELSAWVEDGAIVYHGRSSDIRPHLRAAAVVVLPSYREGCPRVLLEAGATGRPVVACDVPGSRSVVRPEVTGWLTTVRDATALADTLLIATDTPEAIREAMGVAGRRRVVEQFNSRLVNATYLAATGGE